MPAGMFGRSHSKIQEVAQLSSAAKRLHSRAFQRTKIIAPEDEVPRGSSTLSLCSAATPDFLGHSVAMDDDGPAVAMSNANRHSLMAMAVVIAITVAIVVMNAHADAARAHTDRHALRIGRQREADAVCADT